MMKLRHSNTGFTLIEMSIVLVIIGLIIGGILVGRDLISSAAVRAQIAQIEKYNSAVNAFHNKYGGIPGDLNIALSQQFGFTILHCGGVGGSRDGNGLIDGNAGNTLTEDQGETGLFWQDLSMANLIDSTFPNGVVTNGCSAVSASTLTTTTINEVLPFARLGGNNLFVYVYEDHGTNFFGLSAITSIMSSGQTFSSTGIPVIQAYNIDKKTDDALPTSGSVTAVYLNGGYQPGNEAIAPNAATDTASTCYSGSAGSYAYSLSATANQGAGLNCALSFKFE